MNSKASKTAGTLYMVLLLATLWLSSCSTPKDITYFQDYESLNGMALQAEQQFRLRPEDKINIVVNSSAATPWVARRRQRCLTPMPSATASPSPTP